jgi:hypothetical protein
METNWVKLTAINNRQKAEILRTLLESNGIPTVIIDKKVSLYNFGEVELYCHADDALKALELIEYNFPL